jgi:hypothetical protein
MLRGPDRYAVAGPREVSVLLRPLRSIVVPPSTEGPATLARRGRKIEADRTVITVDCVPDP